jgi:hypothetical protein
VNEAAGAYHKGKKEKEKIKETGGNQVFHNFLI